MELRFPGVKNMRLSEGYWVVMVVMADLPILRLQSVHKFRRIPVTFINPRLMMDSGVVLKTRLELLELTQRQRRFVVLRLMTLTWRSQLGTRLVLISRPVQLRVVKVGQVTVIPLVTVSVFLSTFLSVRWGKNAVRVQNRSRR